MWPLHTAYRRRGIAAALLLTVSCRATAGDPTPAPIETLADFTAALSRAGVPYAEVGSAPGTVAGVPGMLLQVGAAQVQVFQFESEADRRSVSVAIEADGSLDGVSLADWQGPPHVWATGRLLVLYPGLEGGVVLLLNGLLGDPLGLQPAPGDEPFPPAVSAAVAALSDELGLAPERIGVLSYAAVDWPDSCLGAAQPDEMCAQVITPGWRIRLAVDGQQYQMHTDQLGQQVRRP